MSLRMVKLERDPRSGSWKARKVIPADIRAAYGKANETRTWPASFSPAQARAAYAPWLGEVETRIARLRDLTSAPERNLTNREVHALARRWYDQQVARYEDDPGPEIAWEAAVDELEYVDGDAAYEAHLRGHEYEGPVRHLPQLVDQVDRLLEAEGLKVAAGSRADLLDQVHDLYPSLCRLLARRAAGDYGPDVLPHTAPAWEPSAPSAAPAAAPKDRSSPTLTDLFDRYIAERRPAAATEKSFRRHVQHLKDYLGHENAAQVTAADIVRWKEELLAGGRKAKTVRETYLAAVKVVFSFGVENRLVPSNPAAGVTVRQARPVRVRERALSDAEAKLILQATLRSVPQGASVERRRAIRWVPWLCAYTGARVNEMTQLRGEDVRQVDGTWVLHITPEAGSTKTHEAREVPVHSHLIEQGLLDVVKDVGTGPLFYDPRRSRGGAQANPQYKKVGEALARWVRDVGVTDRNVAPNHGWRHRFETVAREVGIDIEARHQIVGHAMPSQSGEYGRWTVRALSREVEKLPRYDVAD